MVSTTISATEMKNIKAETSTTQEPHEIEYVDVELFSEDGEMKNGNGKVLIVEWVEIFYEAVFLFQCTFLPKEMVSTTTITHEMKNIKVETSSTQEPHEIEYVDNDLFSGDEEMKVGLGKVLTVEWVEIYRSIYIFMYFLTY